MLKIFKHSKNEEGNSSLVWYILMAPLMVLLLGYGIDTSLATLTKNTLQQALDQATQSAVSLAANPGKDGNVTNDVSVITPQVETKILDTFHQVYDANRMGQLNNLICQNNNPQPETPGTVYVPNSGCGWSEVTLRIVSGGVGNREKYLEAEVVEYSKNPFLAMINLPTQQYTITSQATITSANQ